jgi:hypothetical protein
MTVHPVGVAHQAGEADANRIRDRFSVPDGEGHRGGSTRGRPIQCLDLQAIERGNAVELMPRYKV